MRTADGAPMLLSHFDNDPSDRAFYYYQTIEGAREVLESSLRRGLTPTDSMYLDSGYYKKDGKWVPDDHE